MNTKTPTIILSDCNETEVLTLAQQVLLVGGVIAVPTDTVYGLACTLENTEKLYHVKGRPESNPVAVCVASAQGMVLVVKDNRFAEGSVMI